ncbi:MAG TPA: metalloregulator ArsR/SmtB family transcription factor [Acidisphaera sp.]|nr:metalloregulator ArsR/SmtB family transcription factor [Acidisphaera sp.]
MMTLDQTFSALADPTRRTILARLAQGEATVGELAEPFAISLPAISRHLRVLEDASLIVRERQGQHRVCRLQPEPLANASEWLDAYRRFWSEAFDRLDAHLKPSPAPKKGSTDGRD